MLEKLVSRVPLNVVTGERAGDLHVFELAEIQMNEETSDHPTTTELINIIRYLPWFIGAAEAISECIDIGVKECPVAFLKNAEAIARIFKQIEGVNNG